MSVAAPSHVHLHAAARPDRRSIPVAASLLVGLGGLLAGVTGPLISTFVPPLVGEVLGGRRALIGAVMAIDNVLLLAIVPWIGPASDRAVRRGAGRLGIVVAGTAIAALGLALLPATAGHGLALLVAAIVVLHTGLNLQRGPQQALVADVVPSRWRTIAAASAVGQMAIGSVAILGLGRAHGMAPAFRVAAATLVAIAVVQALGLRHATRGGAAAVADRADAWRHGLRALAHAARALARGRVAGMRATLVAVLLLQLTFQGFATWYALHAAERFALAPAAVTTGFVAWAVGVAVGALPAGALAVQLGRRRAMLLGLATMAACLVALDRVTSSAATLPLLAVAAVGWTLPATSAYPAFIEAVAPDARGAYTSLYMLCTALAGAIGDPLDGWLFDRLGSYRALFLLLAAFAALATLAVLAIPAGAGEAAREDALAA